MQNIKSKITSILLWSQRYTKADMLYIAKGGFWMMFGQATNAILSLLLLIAFANLLPKETYGTYRYILSIAGILNIFSLTGMNAAVARTVARGNDGVLRRAVSHQLKWHLLMFFSFLILGCYYLMQGDTVFGASMFILGICIPFTLAFNTYSAFLEGKKEFKLANILGVLATLFYTLGMFSVLLFSDSVEVLIAAYALTTFIPSVAFYIYIVEKFAIPETDASETLQYGKTLTLIKLLGPISAHIDKIILAHFWGPAPLATYFLASTIPNKAVPAIKKLVDIGFPKFATKSSDSINEVFNRRIFQGIAAGLLATLGYIIIAPFLFRYFLPQYLDSVFYSQILALCFIFALPTRYIGLLLESQKMTRITFFNTLINSSLAILLYLGMGIFGGITGLVIAAVMHSFIGFLVNLISWKRAVRHNN